MKQDKGKNMSTENQNPENTGMTHEQPVSSRLLVYIGCSGWTSAGRNHAKHIAGKDRKPICGKEYKGGALDVYEGELSDITCGRCLSRNGC